MKKFYLLGAALIVAGAANAESLSFSMGETPVVNGEEITFTDAELDMMGSYHAVTFDPHMSLTADFTGKVNVQANCISGQEIQMCAGGLCEFNTVVTKNDVEVTAGTPLDLKFEYMATVESLDEITDVTTELSAVKSDNPGVAVECVVVFHLNKDGIASITTENLLSFNNGAISFNVANPAAFNVYSVSGNRVMNATLSGNGTLNADLAPGMYVYSLGNRTGKFIVR